MTHPHTRWYNNVNNYQMKMQFLNQHFGGYVGTSPSVTTTLNYQPVAMQESNKIEHEIAAKVKLKAAIAAEKLQQEDIFKKQLERNLQIQRDLKEQLQLLESQMLKLQNISSPESQRLLMKNAKIHLKIDEKLKTTNNAIDLLSDIIREDSKSSNRTQEPPVPPTSGFLEMNLSPTRLTQDIFNDLRTLFPEANISNSVFESTKFGKSQFNYIHYDPEMHWCKECDCFPKTAEEYLKHLHSKEHEKRIKNKPTQEPPWHLQDSSDNELTSYCDRPKKSIPIQGVQHLIPASAWFCKLCNKWMGDLHCATLHLKSKTHFDGYSKFLEQNPHWEVDWMSNRQKTYEKILSKEYEIAYPSSKAIKNTGSGSADLDGMDKDKKIKNVEICRKYNSKSSHTSESEDNRKNKWEDRSENKRANLKRKRSSISPSSALNSSDTSSSEEDFNKFKSKVTFKIKKSSAILPKLSSMSSRKPSKKNVFKRNIRKYQLPSGSECGKTFECEKSKILIKSIESALSIDKSPKFTSSDSSYNTLSDRRKKFQKVANLSSSSESGRWISDNEDSKELMDELNSIRLNKLKSKPEEKKWIPITQKSANKLLHDSEISI